jgi:hypothetical protein
MTSQFGLTNEAIQRYAPSAFAVQPYHAQSSRYAFIPTVDVIDGMRNAGFFPVKASQSRSRIEGKSAFTKHMIRFRAEDKSLVVGDSLLECVLINSHDGSSAYKLMCGIFRLVCSNGMVVADSLLSSISIRHQGDIVRAVVDGSHRIVDSAPKVLDTVRDWQGITLTLPEQRVLAESAHSLRFPVVENEDGSTSPNPTNVTPAHLLEAQRYADNKPDLWSTFNRLQENSIRGIRTRGMSGTGRFERITSRAVKSIDGDVRLNRALWSLGERMAEIKRAA